VGPLTPASGEPGLPIHTEPGCAADLADLTRVLCGQLLFAVESISLNGVLVYQVADLKAAPRRLKEGDLSRGRTFDIP
jgi:hypothetical protein